MRLFIICPILPAKGEPPIVGSARVDAVLPAGSSRRGIS